MATTCLLGAHWAVLPLGEYSEFTWKWETMTGWGWIPHLGTTTTLSGKSQKALLGWWCTPPSYDDHSTWKITESLAIEGGTTLSFSDDYPTQKRLLRVGLWTDTSLTTVMTTIAPVWLVNWHKLDSLRHNSVTTTTPTGKRAQRTWERAHNHCTTGYGNWV